MTNLLIEYDMICTNIYSDMSLDIYIYIYILLHVDQNVSDSQMTKSYMTYAANVCIQWMRMMIVCM